MSYFKHETAIIDEGAVIGDNTRIWHWVHICGNTIGQHAFIGAGAVVTRNVPDHALMVGIPARQIGWMCQCGERLSDKFVCLSCEKQYRQTETGLCECEKHTRQDEYQRSAIQNPTSSICSTCLF